MIRKELDYMPMGKVYTHKELMERKAKADYERRETAKLVFVIALIVLTIIFV